MSSTLRCAASDTPKNFVSLIIPVYSEFANKILILQANAAKIHRGKLGGGEVSPLAPALLNLCVEFCFAKLLKDLRGAAP